MGSVLELRASGSKTGSTFVIFAQDRSVEVLPQKAAIPQQGTTSRHEEAAQKGAAGQQKTIIARLDFDNIKDSIFIVRSLLLAIAKEAVFKSPAQEVAIAELRRDILSLHTKSVISDVDFFKVNNQFYAVLCRLNGFQRVTDILANEKRNIDRALRLSLGRQGDYRPITYLYLNVLSGIQSGDPETTKKALCELVTAFDKCANTAKADCGEFALRENNSVSVNP